jgi:MoxR-like ATPase
MNKPHDAHSRYEDEGQALNNFDMYFQRFCAVQSRINSLIIGQQKVVDLVLTVVLAGGHALVVGVPGLAKTRLVKYTGQILGLDTGRVQFTPDLMPSDITGTEILDKDSEGKKYFSFIKGPVFKQLLIADEINRATPKTQSALLQAMQEHHITIAGKHYDLPKPFHVLATQNPIEQEGTYPLPEAQLDRFMMEINVHYPKIEDERKILTTVRQADSNNEIEPLMEGEFLLRLQSYIVNLPVGDMVVNAVLRIMSSLRPQGKDAHDMAKKYLLWGPGIRGGQFLIAAARTHAFIKGRSVPDIDDVISVVKPVLRHRLSPKYTAIADGISRNHIIEEIVKAVV